MSSEELPPRESMEFDVVIVGAGPSGLAAAIRLKQRNADLNIVVVEKGSEIGAHILSGMVMDPIALDKLVPDWRGDSDCPLKTEVKDDRFYWMSAGGAIRLPNFMMPPLMSNHHCYIGSLRDVCCWLGAQTGAPGRAASRSIPVLPRWKCFTTTMARCGASPPATWASRATVRTRPRSPAAWN